MKLGELNEVQQDVLVTRRVILASVLSAVICLAYFYMLDRLFFSSANFSPMFQFLLTGYDAQIAWITVAVCILAALWKPSTWLPRLVDQLGRTPAGLVVAGVTIASLGANFLYHAYPFSMDEYAAVFQAKIFASGRINSLLPPASIDWLFVRGFNGSFLIASGETGKVIEGYWPGFALLLAPFELLAAPWLCNALLAGLAIYLIYQITLDITSDRRAAGWAMAFSLASGAFLANAMSLYSMQAHLTANLLFAWLLLKPTRERAIGAGFVGSFALILHNPMPHMLFALPWLFALARRTETRRFLFPLILAYLPVTLGVGLGWVLLRHAIMPTSHDPIDAIAYGVFNWPNLAILNMRAAAFVKLWLWAVPGLFLFAILGFTRRRGDWRVEVLAQSAALTFFGYLFVNLDQGHGWGYRYFHSAWGAIPILAACAMSGRLESDLRLASFAGASCILSILVIVPLQMLQIEHLVARHLAQLPAPKRPGRNVFFVRPGGGFYLADMIQADPFLRTQDLLLVSHGIDADADLVRRSWPNAIASGNGAWGDQWYLAPISQAGSEDLVQKRWQFNFGESRRSD